MSRSVTSCSADSFDKTSFFTTPSRLHIRGISCRPYLALITLHYKSMNPYITKYELTYDETLMMTIVNTRNHSASGLGIQSCDPKYTFISVFNNSGRFRTQQRTVYSTHIIHLLFTHHRAYLLSSHSLSFCSGVESGITHRAINVSFLPFSFIYRIH